MSKRLSQEQRAALVDIALKIIFDSLSTHVPCVGAKGNSVAWEKKVIKEYHKVMGILIELL